MARNLLWRFIIVAVVVLTGVIFLLPSVTENLPSWWKERVDKIHLGLDLQGGMHLITEVQTEEALENALDQSSQNIEEVLDEEKVPFIEIILRKNRTIAIELLDASDDDKFRTIMEKEFPNLKRVDTEKEKDLYRPIFQLDENESQHIKDLAVRQALETIRNRIDQFGVTEPTIQRQGKDRILIQLPGVKDPERAKDLLITTAMLEFKLVNREASWEEALKGKVPPDSQILYEEVKNKETGTVIDKRPWLLKKRTLLTGDRLVDARVSLDSAQPYVSLRFDSKGAKIFKTVTAANVGEQLAIVLDNVVESAPVIKDAISGGRAQITGSFTMQEAKDLAIVLRAGALPAPIKFLEERTVGPSLGKDSIDKGLNSIKIGALLIVVFIIIYYKFSGIVANLALAFNIILIFGALAAFKATLTLPGIAGIVLVIGMAIDANVLIFERIREEVRSGKTTWASIDGGYSKALFTIIDANITTIIAAIVLFQFGTGPIKGFALTLMIGIAASLFTAIVVTRLIFDYLVIQRKREKISI